MSTEDVPIEVEEGGNQKKDDPSGELSYLTICALLLWCLEIAVVAFLVFS